MSRVLPAAVILVALAGAGAAAQPRMNDGTGTEMPARQDERPTPAGTADRRPFLIGGGVAVLAVIFVWNRRRRAALDRQSEDETRRLRADARAARAVNPPVAVDPTDAPDAPDDPDAADLRAAARSDQEPT